MKTYSLEILTPRGRFFSGEVVHSLVPAEDGFVGVLANHTAYLTSSPGGRLEARLASGETKSFHVGTGFFQFLQNEAFFLTHSVNVGAIHQLVERRSAAGSSGAGRSARHESPLPSH